jgi:hypothetical protein
MLVIWLKAEAEYFCGGGWTGKSLICPVVRANDRSRPIPRNRDRSVKRTKTKLVCMLTRESNPPRDSYRRHPRLRRSQRLQQARTPTRLWRSDLNYHSIAPVGGTAVLESCMSASSASLFAQAPCQLSEETELFYRPLLSFHSAELPRFASG